MEQASKPSVNEQNQVQPPPDNKRNRVLKLLALKVAAHLKWDLDILEKRYKAVNGITFEAVFECLCFCLDSNVFLIVA